MKDNKNRRAINDEKKQIQIYKQQLITGHFKEVKTSLAAKKELSRDERYGYGFSLLKTGHLLEALAAWQPLHGKFSNDLDVQLKVLSVNIFRPTEWNKQRLQALSLAEAIPLYSSARTYCRDLPITLHLRFGIYSKLWASTSVDDTERLVKLLDSTHEGIDVFNFLNLVKTKLKLFELRKETEVQHLAGIIVSGLATYVAALDNSNFRKNLLSLARVAKNILFAQKRIESKSAIIFFDVQIEVMCKLHEHLLAAKSNQSSAILLSPAHYAALGGSAKLSLEFTPYLQHLPIVIAEYYSPRGFEHFKLQAGIGDVAVRKKTLQKVIQEQQSQLNTAAPQQVCLFACLAMELGMAEGFDFLENLINKNLMDEELLNQHFFNFFAAYEDKYSPVFVKWLKLAVDVIPAKTWHTPMRQALTRHLVRISTQLLEQNNRWDKYLQQALSFCDDVAMTASIQQTLQRLTAAQAFLDLFMKKKTFDKIYSKIYKGNGTLEETQEFLSLFIDAITLTIPWLDFWTDPDNESSGSMLLFIFLRKILVCKKLNQLIPVGSLFPKFPRSNCSDCQKMIFIEIVDLARKAWQLPEVAFPVANQIPQHRSFTTPTENMTPLRLMKDAGNPFRVLGLDKTCSKPQVLTRTLELIRAEPERMGDWRRAQAELFDPQQRIAHEFFGFLEYPTLPPLENEGGCEEVAPLEGITLIPSWSKYEST